MMTLFSSVNTLCGGTFLAVLGRSVSRHLHTSRHPLLASHYDTLQVNKNCSHKEIREAFLKLSKEYHPDKNPNDPNKQAQFVKVNEAYSILSKPSQRHNYDLSLPTQQSVSGGSTNTSQTDERGPFRDNTFWEQRDKSKDKKYAHKPYYGIVGLKKLSNSWVVAFCFFFTVFGVGLQLLAISKSMAFQRDHLDEASIRNGLLHSYVREQARSNSKEMQIELVRKRLLSTGPKHAGPDIKGSDA